MTEDNSDWQSTASIEIIKQRAQMLQDIRAFFNAKDVLEIETPLLSEFCTTDPHLHSFSTAYQNKSYYLNTSPEYAMKRFLAQYQLPVFQICKSFRLDELGPNHNPEFTMLEWYRPSFTLTQLMDEVELLLNDIFSETFIIQRVSYQSIFEKYAGFNPHSVSAQQCKQCAVGHQIEIPVGLENDIDEWLDWLLTQLVLPALDKEQFTIVYDYPKSQCALAKLHENNQGVTVAARFELFYGEIELANGFNELSDVDEQKRRFNGELKVRQQQKSVMPIIDERFLSALNHGLPDCSGVAVGLDRLLMLISNKNKLSDVIAYPWARC